MIENQTILLKCIFSQKSAKKVKERYFLYFSGNRINKNGFEKNLYQ